MYHNLFKEDIDLKRLDNITDKIWEIIEGSWKQKPEERLTIQEIKKEFDEI